MTGQVNWDGDEIDEQHELDDGDGESDKYYGKEKQDDSVDDIEEYEVKLMCQIEYYGGDVVHDKVYDDYDNDDDNDQGASYENTHRRFNVVFMSETLSSSV